MNTPDDFLDREAFAAAEAKADDLRTQLNNAGSPFETMWLRVFHDDARQLVASLRKEAEIRWAVDAVLQGGTIDDPVSVLAAVAICSGDLPSRLDPVEIRGCDGCDRRIWADPLEELTRGWSTAFDADGVPDVAICPACLAIGQLPGAP